MRKSALAHANVNEQVHFARTGAPMVEGHIPCTGTAGLEEVELKDVERGRSSLS